MFCLRFLWQHLSKLNLDLWKSVWLQQPPRGKADHILWQPQLRVKWVRQAPSQRPTISGSTETIRYPCCEWSGCLQVGSCQLRRCAWQSWHVQWRHQDMLEFLTRILLNCLETALLLTLILSIFSQLGRDFPKLFLENFSCPKRDIIVFFLLLFLKVYFCEHFNKNFHIK